MFKKTPTGKTIVIIAVILLASILVFRNKLEYLFNSPNDMRSKLAHIAKTRNMQTIREDYLRKTKKDFDNTANPVSLEKYKFYAIYAETLFSLYRYPEAITYFTSAIDLIPKIREEKSLPISELNRQARHLYFSALVTHIYLADCNKKDSPNSSHDKIFPSWQNTCPSENQHLITAISILKQLLAINADDLTAKWLLNLAYMKIGQYPKGVPKNYLIDPAVFESAENIPRFKNIASQIGIDHFGLSGGTLLEDLDGDNLIDIIATSVDIRTQIRYFHNNGDGTFIDKTAEAGLLGITGGDNIIQGDYDNDGFVDLFIVRGAWLGSLDNYPYTLLHNNGNGTFTDVTIKAGLAKKFYPALSVAWADFDNDGYLDLYVGSQMSLNTLLPAAVDPTTTAAVKFYPSQLFHNNGNGTFTDIAKEAGVENRHHTTAVSWGDYDKDGYPDLYVSNLGSNNRLYHNNRNKTFTDVAMELNVTEPFYSTTAWFWDFNNDGNLDIFVPNYTIVTDEIIAGYLNLPIAQKTANRLYRGDGQGGFRDVSSEQDFNYPIAGAGSNLGDIDNDGFPDLFLGNSPLFNEGIFPQKVLRTVKGKHFSDITKAGGFGYIGEGSCVSFADLDNDGDQDILQEITDPQFGPQTTNLFENPGFGNNWITIKLIGVKSNRSAIGARIQIEVKEKDGNRFIYADVNSGGSFGANSLQQEIGLGQAVKINSLKIFWPTSNLTQIFENVPINEFLEIHEGDDKYRTVKRKKIMLTQ